MLLLPVASCGPHVPVKLSLTYVCYNVGLHTVVVTSDGTLTDTHRGASRGCYLGDACAVYGVSTAQQSLWKCTVGLD